MKRVLITAGASGIGRAMGMAFAADGWDVWVTDIDVTDCPPTWTAHRADVSDAADMAGVFAAITADGRGLHAVCANAGIAGPTAQVTDVDLADWQRCVSVNLEGAFLTAKYAGPLLQAAGGAITFTSSTAGIYGYPNRAPYAAAKWGIIGLMKTVAMEWGPLGVRANAICPGAVEGARMDGVIAREAQAKDTTPKAIYAGYAEGVSMKSFVRAEDIANMALFLSTPNARMVSGQVIAVDGHTENPDPKV